MYVRERVEKFIAGTLALRTWLSLFAEVNCDVRSALCRKRRHFFNLPDKSVR